jgi:hypothetical protein
MKHLILTVALAAGVVTAAPTAAQAQFVGGLQNQRLAQRQVIGWFQAYLGRLPNAQELAVLTNQYALTGNALYVQSVILASNEFYARSGNTPYGFINRLFALTMGRTATVAELATFQNQVIFNGRLWFVQTYLSQIAGGWQFNNWNNAVATVPVPVVIPILIR